MIEKKLKHNSYHEVCLVCTSIESEIQ